LLRQNISGVSPFEPLIGFSRAVRCGDWICVSGTGPVGAEDLDAAGQTGRAFEIIREALHKAGATLEDVVRTRMYMTNAADWEQVGAVHNQLFRAILPAATMIVGAGLLHPSWRIEVEVDALVAGNK
jgi:enamine deaminase RidA (YjgF/YER057c/UK114 family)